MTHRRDRPHVPLGRHARRRAAERAIPPAVAALAARHGVLIADPDGRGQEVRLVTPATAGRVKALRGWVGLRVVLVAGQVRTLYREDWRRAWWQW